MKSSLPLVVGVFISSDSLADDRCGNTPQFLAEQRARAGGQSAPAGRALLSAPRAGQSAENGPKLAAPYPGSNSLGEPLMSALNTGWVFERTTVIDENTTRIERSTSSLAEPIPTTQRPIRTAGSWISRGGLNSNSMCSERH